MSSDPLAAEEPLEIRVRGVPVAVLMRLPGRERDLVAGFLAAEGILRHAEDLSAVEPCRDPRTGQWEPNIWNAALAEGVAFDPRAARGGVVSASCGLCGVESLKALELRLPASLPRQVGEQLSLAVLDAAFQRLRAEQPVFCRTAGTHAAALIRPDGAWLDCAEDVGRHNAVDKVLGACLRRGDYPLAEPAVLLVSGRISFEVIQKAACAGLGAVAGVGVPTSLAWQAAHGFQLRLYGLVRDGRANLYTGI